MARDNNKKIIMIIALIAVISISIGFAAFSSSLIIKSELNVDPTLGNFSVVFSTSPNELKEGTVSASPVPTTLEATDAVINNSLNSYPMISDMDVVFTQPGQYVTYEFYAINKGQYPAYLTSIVLENLESGKYQECIAGEGATQESADSACDSMQVTVTVGSESVTSTKTGIKNHKLQIDESEKVTIKIEYLSTGTVADGPVEVNFGNIFLTYGTQMTGEIPEFAVTEKECYISNDVNNDGIADIGDKITCASESFYVMSTTEDTITMLAEYNLNVGSTTNPNAIIGLQHSSVVGAKTGVTKYGDVVFLSEKLYDSNNKRVGYWHDASGTKTTKAEYFVDGQTYPFVYDSNSDLYAYVEAYESQLKNFGVYSADATLPTYDQLINLGCTTSSGCTSSEYSWLYSTVYWTGSAYDGDSLWRVYAAGTFAHGGNSINSAGYGIRPAVTISKKEVIVNASEYKICTLASDSTVFGTNVGAKYNCPVNDTESYSFYVLSTSMDNAVLLLDRNLEDNVPYIIPEDGGTWLTTDLYVEDYYEPRLETLTGNWNNSAISSVRGPTYKELSALCPSEGTSNSDELGYETKPHKYGCPDWVTSSSYWTWGGSYGDILEDYYPSEWAIDSEYKTLDDYSIYWGIEFGIRPVIIVPIASLEF